MTQKRSKTKNKKLSPQQLKFNILSLFKRNPKNRYTAKQIVRKLKILNSKDSVQHALNTMNKEGDVVFVKAGIFRLNKAQSTKRENEKSHGKGPIYEGKADIIKSGAAYVIVKDLEDDIYVAPRYTLNAFNGDRVKVQQVLNNRRKPEGRIIEIVERANAKVVGRVWKHDNYAVVHTSYKTAIAEVYVKLKDLGSAVDKDYVQVEITDWSGSQNKGIWGKVERVLEEYNPSEIAMNTILVNSGFDAAFPKEVMEECALIPDAISSEEITSRRDFRETLTFTIDPDTAKDFDDAISYYETENGEIEIGVHIADVTHYLREDSALDKEALERSTSVYLVDRVIPMLPEKLSNNLCSLVPNQDRLVFSAVFTFDKDYKITDRWFGKGVIYSDRRFTYEEAQKILEDKGGQFATELQKTNDIAHHLRKLKFKNGALSFESDEVKFKLDEQGKPIGIYVKERKDAHMLIEDFMLLANKEVAKYIHKKAKGNEIPFVYRIHDEPDPERLADFALFARELGFQMDVSTPKQIAKSFKRLSAKAKENDQFKMLEPLGIRTMAKAEYSTENIGHYGLAFEFYSHFTSPIRRYADVLVHRLLYKNLEETFRTNKTKLQARCEHISQQERKATKAERESIKFKQVEFLQDKIGQVFKGQISGMIDRGIFVELVESKAEGLISFDKFNEGFSVSDSRLKATGNRSGKVLKMGDYVDVKVLETNLEIMQIELEIVNQE